jgi:hypothetical protein
MFFLMVGFYHGLPAAITRGELVPPIRSRWMRVSREEYAELLADGFVVAMAWAGTEPEEQS